MDLKVGPINSLFNGILEVRDKVEGERYNLKIDVEGKIGTVNALGSIQLSPEGEDTTVNFEGNAKLSGPIARLGQRVMSGVSRLFMKQFFKGLEQEVEKAKTVSGLTPPENRRHASWEYLLRLR